MQLAEDTATSSDLKRGARLSRAELASTPIMVDARHPLRGSAERWIERAYKCAFDCASVRHFPHLIAICNSRGEVAAAAGFRWARVEPLFLEHYLDEPIETVVAQIGLDWTREEIVEIGGLAADGSGASALLFAALADHLYREGAGFAVATATRPLRRIFGLVGFKTVRIGAAVPERLPDAGKSWGRYYEYDPVIVGGAVDVCSEQLTKRALGLAGDHAR